jgi:hypothetical protein
MTPKEKAKELFNKYFLLNESASDENGVWIISALNKGLTKKCALISVDEIINVCLPSSEYGGVITDNTVEYWKEVKQEIDKL